MRVKKLASCLPKPSHLRLIYARLTSSPLTTFFTALSLTHFVLQLSFQAWAFSINVDASSFLSNILTTGGLNPQDNFAVLVPLSQSSNGTTTGGELRICDDEEMQMHENIFQCPIVWKGGVVAVSAVGSANATSSATATGTAIPDAQVIGFSTSFLTTSATLASTQIPSTVTTADVSVVTTTIREEANGDDFTSGVSAVGGGLSQQATENVSRDLEQRDHNVTPIAIWRRHVPVEAAGNASSDGLTSVSLPTFKNLTTGAMGITLSEQCVQMIVWPNQIIHNTKREDVTFLAFQTWVLGMSLVALLNESIPHTLAALLTHLLATAWSAYQIFNTRSFQSEFVRSTIESGRCDGVNLLPGYWSQRRGAEIAVLVVNCVSLVAGAVLSWKLVKMFGWQTFKRIGASLEINKLYKLVLVFSIGLQLGFFFVVASTGLWLDSLFNTILGRSAENVVLYKTFSILTCILMAPWSSLGWYSVRRENDKLIAAFLALSLLMLAGLGSLFFSSTFRWEFIQWKFFAAMTVASSVLLVITTVLGVVCWYNFDKGLKRFLTEEQSPDHEKDQFTRVYSHEFGIEKSNLDVVNFPSSGPIPTYAVAFGKTAKTFDRQSVISSEFSEEVGSPLHDPSFSDVERGYGYTQNINLPPRFQTHPSLSRPESPESLSMQTNYLATIHQNVDIGRADSATSSETGTNPFSLDMEGRSSISSGTSGKSKGQGPHKTYVTAGSHHVPTITTMQLKQGSQGSRDARKNWMIE